MSSEVGLGKFFMTDLESLSPVCGQGVPGLGPSVVPSRVLWGLRSFEKAPPKSSRCQVDSHQFCLLILLHCSAFTTQCAGSWGMETSVGRWGGGEAFAPIYGLSPPPGAQGGPPQPRGCLVPWT